MKSRPLNCYSHALSALLLLTFIVSFDTFGQDTEVDRAIAVVKRWQLRVTDLDDGINSDSKSIAIEDKALYFALLSKIWWKQNNHRAIAYLKRSAEYTLLSIQTEDPKTTKSLENATAVVEIISKLDSGAALQLVDEISKFLAESRNSSDTKENPDLAEVIVSFCKQLASSKPELAAGCGQNSLKYGLARSLPALIAELNVREPTLAESLYEGANVRLTGNYTRQAVQFEYNFAKFVFDVFGESKFGGTFRKRFLNRYVDRLALAARDETFRIDRCGITMFANDMLTRVDQTLPERAVEARQSVDICRSDVGFSSSSNQQLPSADESIRAVDDLISAALNAQNTYLKVTYWRKALSILTSQKKFAETVSILDSTKGDDLKVAAPIVWSNWRVGAAVGLVTAQFEEQQIPDAYRTIERVPKELRPQVRLSVAKKFSADKTSAFYSDNLDAMIKDLSGIDIADIDAVSFYLALTELMLEMRPQESESMFRLAAKHINKVDRASTEPGPDTDWEWERYYIRLDAKILELDESGINSSLESIGSRRSRVRLKMGLLESALKYQAEAKKKYDLLVKAKSTKRAKPTLN